MSEHARVGDGAVKDANQPQAQPDPAQHHEEQPQTTLPRRPAGQRGGGDILALQRTVGNRAVQHQLSGARQGQSAVARKPAAPAAPVIQRKAVSDEERIAYTKKYPVAAEIVAGIDVNAPVPDILDTMVDRFNNSGFTYTMQYKLGTTFLGGNRSGDCATLATAFVDIATNYFGIEGIKTDSKKTDYFVPFGGRVNDSNGSTGNVDDGAHWVFTTHTWVDGPDRTRDLLFLGAEVNKSNWLDMTAQGKQQGLEYRDFGDEYTVFDYKSLGGLSNRYTNYLAKALQAKQENEEEIARLVADQRARTKAAKKKFCFLTTACVEVKGLPDDCRELTVLRKFRDGYMARLAGGKRMIEEYYHIAPQIIERIEATGQGRQIFLGLYDEIVECVELIEAGRKAEALSRYSSVVIRLKHEWL